VYRHVLVELEDGQVGWLVSLGVHVSRIEYESDGHVFNVLVPNEDYEVLQTIEFDYEEE
jgi:hypothetical protein